MGVNPTSPDTTSGQYLDLNRPATCAGTLIAWHLCYYAPDNVGGQPMTYQVWFRVWRPTDSQTLQRISSARQDIAIQRAREGSFLCENITLAAADRIAIQVGDILGVYIPTNNAGLQPLWVIAAATAGYGVFNDGRATLTAFFGTTLQRDDLQERPALGLHLYADVCEFSI